jgi:hypothetical protein
VLRFRVLRCQVLRCDREAFTVTEDGQPREIEQFADGAVPVSLIVALDASGSMAGGRFAYATEAS